MQTKIRRLFSKACAEYGLLEDGDKVLVALSGGKDSMELVRLLGMQQRILKPRIEVAAVHVVMDNVPYSSDIEYLEQFCSDNGVKLEVLHTSFVPSEKKPPCFLCSWNRRKAIFEYARAHEYNKVALGHHQDDILVTLLMNMTFEGSIQTMPPKMVMEHYPITVIRPLCLVPEALIKQVSEAEGFVQQQKKCPYEHATRRKDFEDLFHHLESMNPEARYSLWRSMTNIKPDLLPQILK